VVLARATKANRAVVFVQERNAGRILGVATLELDR
jgi:hypothetical protein